MSHLQTNSFKRDICDAKCNAVLMLNHDPQLDVLLEIMLEIIFYTVLSAHTFHLYSTFITHWKQGRIFNEIIGPHVELHKILIIQKHVHIARVET